MIFKRRSFQGQTDLDHMIELVLSHPSENQHVVDLVYRLCSWAITDIQNIALWENENKELVGWAVAQQPFSSLDYTLHPTIPRLEEQIIQWGKQRWHSIAEKRKMDTYFFIGAQENQIERVRRLQEHGFQKDDWSLSHMVKSLETSLPQTSLPDGFDIRSLAGEKEIEAYTKLHQAAFGTKNMTEDWRKRILQAREYTPALDLVITNPENALVAFCICWKCQIQEDILGQVEPIGVHPNYRGLGLGKAILIEGLQQMRVQEVETAFIEADSSNPISQNLYKKVGFQTIYETRAYYIILPAG